MGDILNSKNQYFHLNVNRVKLNRSENAQQCNKCGRMLKSEEELSKHDNDIHVQFKCQICDYLTFGKKDLVSHMKMKHVVTDFVILLRKTKTTTTVIPVSVTMPTMLEFILLVAVVILTVTAARETALTWWQPDN